MNKDMNIKKVLLPKQCYYELISKGMTDTATYRYCIFCDSFCYHEVVKRIRREYLGTIATCSDASDNNPNGWQAVKVGMRK